MLSSALSFGNGLHTTSMFYAPGAWLSNSVQSKISHHLRAGEPFNVGLKAMQPLKVPNVLKVAPVGSDQKIGTPVLRVTKNDQDQWEMTRLSKEAPVEILKPRDFPVDTTQVLAAGDVVVIGNRAIQIPRTNFVPVSP